METKVLKYQDARNQIKNGDIIFVSGDNSLMGKLISIVSGSPIFHVGIACWFTGPEGNRILCSIEQWYGGRRIVNLGHYAYNNELIVVENPVPDFHKYMGELIENTGSAYGDVDFVSAGVYQLFKIKLKDHNGEICSEMIMNRINKYLGTNMYSRITPAGLYETLTNTFGCSVKFSVKP